MTFGFMHWDLSHVLLNSLLLLVAGPVVERRSGPFCLLLTFLAASIASGIGISGKHLLLPSHGASVGASGGMFGLLGLALVLVYRCPPRRPVIRGLEAIVSACGFVYSVLPGVSMIGHSVGFAVGVVLGFLIPDGRLVPSRAGG